MNFENLLSLILNLSAKKWVMLSALSLMQESSIELNLTDIA